METFDEIVLPPLEKKPRIDDESWDDEKKEEVNISDSSSSESEGTKSRRSSESESPFDDHHMPSAVDYPSSDEDDIFSYNRISDEDLERYLQEVQVSDGYDVSKLVETFPGCIKPTYLSKETKSVMTGFLLPAIDEHNKHENTELKLVKIVKVNMHHDLTGRYYVTFEAKDGDAGDIKTYQARFVALFDGTGKVEQFRLKPSLAVAE